MTFVFLVYKNLLSNKLRTLLTIAGISIGISTIVVFGIATSGLVDLLSVIIRPGNADFTIIKAGASDVVLSFIDQERVEDIENIEGVEKTIPYIFTITQSGNNPYFFVGGMNSSDIEDYGINIIEGEVYTNSNQIILGKIIAKDKNLEVGNFFEINGKEYMISGIYQTGIAFQDSGSLTTLEESQSIQGIQNQVNTIAVILEDEYELEEVTEQIEASFDDLATIADQEDFESYDQGLKIVNSLSWGISFLAIIVGAIGVMNTIIMSVYERVREIGILRALGWKKQRIILMILAESVLIGLIAVVVGSIIGLIGIKLITLTEIGKAWVQVTIEPTVFIQALIVSLGVVIVGAIYPAYRASQLKPTDALRYE